MGIKNRRTFLSGAALAGGAALLPKQVSSTAISSFSSNSSRVYLTVKPGSADSTTVLNQALATAAKNGQVLYITAGVYNVSGSLSVSMTPAKGFSIIGDGAAVTKIVFTGSSDAFTVVGNFGPNYDPKGDGFRFEGLNLSGPGLTRSGAGLTLLRHGGFVVSDLQVVGFGTGLRLHDSLTGHFSDSIFAYCNDGVLAEAGSLSNPNLHLFTRCTFDSCSRYGLSFFSGSALTLESCEIAANATGIQFSQAGAGQGAVAVTLSGSNYFEGNSQQHIYITHGNFPVVYNLTGAVFNTFTANAGVVFDPYQLKAGSQPAVLNLEGSAFCPGSTYANAPLVLAQPGAGYDGLSVSNRTTLYVPLSSKPVFPPYVHIL